MTNPTTAAATETKTIIIRDIGGAHRDIDGATLCVVYTGGATEQAIEAPASGEGAADRARATGARGCYLMPVSEWAAEHAEHSAYVIDPGSQGQGEDRTACIWWASSIEAAE